MPQIGQLKTATRLNFHIDKLPHAIPLKATLFQNTATYYQKLIKPPPPPSLYHSVGMTLHVRPRVNTPFSYIYISISNGMMRWSNTDSFKCTDQTLHFLFFGCKNKSSTPCFNLTDLLFLDNIF